MEVDNKDVPVSVKIMREKAGADGGAATSHANFSAESSLLMNVLLARERVFGKQAAGFALNTCEKGAANVVSVYGTGEAPNLGAMGMRADDGGRVYYIVLEKLDDTIGQAIEDAPGGLLPLPFIILALRHISLALAFLHSIGIVVRGGVQLGADCRDITSSR